MLKYLLKSISRNKIRSLLLIIGIIISIMLLSGVNFSANQSSASIIKDQLDKNGSDFSLYANGEKYSNGSDIYLPDIAREINKNNASIPNFQMALSTNIINHDSMFLSVNNSNPINWTKISDYYNNSQNDHFSSGIFLGLDQNIFNKPSISSRFSGVINFPINDTEFNKEGIFIDENAAEKFNITEGSVVRLSYYYIYYDYNDVDNGAPSKYEIKGFINAKVLGFFNVLDSNNAIKILTGQYNYYYSSNEVMFIVSNYLYMNNLTTKLINNEMNQFLSNGLIYNPNMNYQGSKAIQIFIDHNTLPYLDTDELENEINQIENKIRYLIQNNNWPLSIQNNLEYIIKAIPMQINAYRAIYIIITLPVILLGWFLVKTTYYLSLEKRRREIALLKIKGGLENQVARMFLAESLILGIMGGIIGLLFGQFSSVPLIKKVFPQMTSTITLSLVIQSFKAPITWLWGIGLGVIMALLALRSPLKQFKKLPPIEGLQKFHEETQSTLPKTKKDWIFLLIGVIPIAMTFITGSIIQGNSSFYYNPLFYLMITITTPLLPVAPFFLMYSLIKIFCGRSLKLFSKLIGFINRIYSKPVATFSTKSIIRNQARSFRLIFIVAMALSFLLMADTITASVDEYQHDKYILETLGGGYEINIENGKLLDNGTTNLLNILNNESNNLNISSINYFYKPSSNNEYNTIQIQSEMDSYFGDFDVWGISTENIIKKVNLKDSWFKDSNANKVIDKLLTEKDVCIASSNFESGGYAVGDNIFYSYSLPNGTMTNISLTIIGFYKAFPGMYDDYDWKPHLLVDNKTISNAKISSMKLFVYTNKENIDQDLSAADYKELIVDYLDSYDTTAAIYYSSADDQSNTMSLFDAIKYFLNIERYYLLAILTFGIGIIMYISINEKAHDFGLLRARGVEKKVIFKIQLAEGTTLILLGIIFSLIGIIGALSLLMYINTMSFGSSLSIPLSIPWVDHIWLFVQAGIFFLIAIFIAVSIEIRKSNIVKIGEILRIE